MKVGVDFGGVIAASRRTGGEPFWDTDDFVRTPGVAGVMSALTLLTELTHNPVTVISFVYPDDETKVMTWLHANGFFSGNGPLLVENVHFVHEREAKAPLAYSLGLDVYVDDRTDILASMQHMVPTRILLDTHATNRWPVPSGVFVAHDWAATVGIIAASVPREFRLGVLTSADEDPAETIANLVDDLGGRAIVNLQGEDLVNEDDQLFVSQFTIRVHDFEAYSVIDQRVQAETNVTRYVGRDTYV